MGTMLTREDILSRLRSKTKTELKGKLEVEALYSEIVKLITAASADEQFKKKLMGYLTFLGMHVENTKKIIE